MAASTSMASIGFYKFHGHQQMPYDLPRNFRHIILSRVNTIC